MDALSDRERVVAGLAMAGHSVASIAGELSLSVRSVENYLYALCAKSGVSSVSELIILASDDKK